MPEISCAPRGTNAALRPLAWTLAALLAACGGGGGGGDDGPFGGGGGGGGGGGAGGGSTATVATAQKVDFPTLGTPDIGSLHATNDGVYLRMYDTTAGTDVIVKRTARGSTPGRWMQWTLPVVAGTYRAAYTDNEGVDEFSIHWVGLSPTYGPPRYGYSNMNNGGISQDYEDDRRMKMIVPDGDASTSGLSWGLKSGEVWRESRRGNASTHFSARYERIATISDTGLGGWPAVADSTGQLYAASGSDLYRIGATGDVEQWDLSQLGYGNIHTLIYKHNRLWIGYRDRILTLGLGEDTIRSFSTLTHPLAATAFGPQFCIAGSTLYAADGTAYGALPSSTTQRPWLQGPGTVPPETLIALTNISSAVQSGMYCAGNGTPTLYAAGIDLADGGKMKLHLITPR